MPPPNITGKLHMGHAMFTTIQDILIRHRRMKGFNTLWLPGCDHAGLATQDKLDAEMRAQGLDPLGDGFDAFAEGYKQRLGGEINEQIRRTGASCDWSRYRFTLDEQYSRAVDRAFTICGEREMIYQEGADTFLDMKVLADRLLAEIDGGNLRIIPESGEKIMRHYLTNIEPWCISRQIRWGHTLPGSSDKLDTWFSSALWPFATLGWPDRTDDLDTFYPAAMIETGDDILFFWCARMLMMGLLLTDKLAFSTIFLHGIIRDKNGEKMSKSKGNGVDPLDIINQYGCDGMRFALAEAATPGQDMRLQPDRLQAGKAMRIKLWNAAKFALPLIGDGEITHPDDLEMLRRTDEATAEIDRRLFDLEIHLGAQAARRFLFDDLCGWYIETAKERLYAGDESARATLKKAFEQTLRICHPMMPFVTEEIWGKLNKGLLISQQW